MTGNGLPARIAGVLLRPRETMQALVARPTWLSTWAALLTVWAVCGALLLATDVGQQALVDERVRVTEAFGGVVDDQTYAAWQAAPPWPMYLASGGRLLLTPAVTLLVALASWGAARVLQPELSAPAQKGSDEIHDAPAAAGGGATLTQALSVAVHASVPLTLGQLVATPVHFVRESLTSPLTMASLVPFADEGTVAARIFGAADLFSVWWACLVGIGIGALARRPARSVVPRVFAVYASVAVILALAQVLSGGQ